jgi:hypothetical protein
LAEVSAEVQRARVALAGTAEDELAALEADLDELVTKAAPGA